MATPTFDGSTLAAWPGKQQCSGNLTDLAGGGWRSHVTCDPINSSGYRAEVLQTSLRQKPGDEGYLHLRLRTSTGGGGWKINTQLHLSQGGTQPTIIIDTLSSLKIKTSTGGGHSTYADLPLRNGQVHTISLHFKLGSAGFIEAIVDGQHFARSNRAVSSDTDTQQYWKAGVYSGVQSCPDADILEWRLSPTPIGQFADDPPPPPPPATWVGDVETGDLSQFAQAGDDDPVTPIATVATDVVRFGTRALRFDMGGPATATRSYQRKFLMPAPFHDWGEGDDQWFGFSLWLDPAFPLSTPHWYDLWQLWNSAGGSPPLEIGPSGDRMSIGGGFGHPAGPKTSSRDAGPLVRGAWMDYVVHVHFSSDPTLGTVDLWRDGTQIVTGYKPIGGTLYPGGRSKLEFGIYREAGDGPLTVRFDELRFGGSYDAVAPKPLPEPTMRLTAPLAGATVSGFMPITIDAKPADAARVYLLVDGQEQYSEASMPIFDSTSADNPIWGPTKTDGYDTKRLADGSHIFRVEARTSGGGVVESAVAQVTVANGAPPPPPPPDCTECENKLTAANAALAAALAEIDHLRDQVAQANSALVTARAGLQVANDLLQDWEDYTGLRDRDFEAIRGAAGRNDLAVWNMRKTLHEIQGRAEQALSREKP